MSTVPPPNYEKHWKVPPQPLTLPADHVHIWKASLSPSESQLLRLQDLLSADEQVRAKRFKFAQHRKAFTTARGILRLILSRYLQSTPQLLKFGQGPHGKPFISHPTTPQLSFNVSHSHNLALYAVTLDSQVGIDIEYHRKKLDVSALIQRVCSNDEKAILTALSPAKQKRDFFACWTRKEAYVKATGKGITIPLEAITVSLPPSKYVELLDLKSNDEKIADWAMADIPVDSDYTAALAIKRVNPTTTYWAWSWNMFDETITAPAIIS